jgi:hypothetical protein
MKRFSSREQMVVLFLCVLAVVTGSGCPSDGRQQPPTVITAIGTHIPADAIGFDMANRTEFDVDPGVFVGQFELNLGTLAPFEGHGDTAVSFQVDCFSGDTLTVDPILFTPAGDAFFAVNAPVVLQQGVDYLCGDNIGIGYTLDGQGNFFADVAVNGVRVSQL